MRTRSFLLLLLACLAPVIARAAPLILNEYNAVGPEKYLNGGVATWDEDGGVAADPYFGRVLANGGDWFELVVVADGLDIRGWKLEIEDDGSLDDTLVFSDDPIWSNLRAGTIITIAEDEPSDPDAGPWWIQVQASDDADGQYITPSNFPVSNDYWMLTIRDDRDRIVFGPAGEGVAPRAGVNSREVLKLEVSPSATVIPADWSYDDGQSSSFGRPNRWSGGLYEQDLATLRSGTPAQDFDFDGVSDCADNCGWVFNPEQRDVGEDGFGNACDPDYDGNGVVGLSDFNTLRSVDGTQAGDAAFDPRVDHDNDDRIGAGDLDVLTAYFGNPPGPGPIALDCSEPDPSAGAFQLHHLLEVSIEMEPEVWHEVRTVNRSALDVFGGSCQLQPPPSPFEFRPGTITVDGVTVENVGIRKKGFWGSIQTAKPSLKVKFDEFVGGQRLFGLDRMTFNNAKQDPSLIEQCTGYPLFRDAGLPAPRCNFAHVVVNGEDLGIYAHVESIKDPFLIANFGSATGNLYEGSAADFRKNYLSVIEAKNGGDLNDARLLQFVLSIEDLDARLAAVKQRVDYDKFLTFWAMEGLLGHWDGYTGNSNNWWVYANPQNDGRFEFMPWSLDDILGGGNRLLMAQGVAPLLNLGSALSVGLYEIPSVRQDLMNRILELFDSVWNTDLILERIAVMEATISGVAGDLSAEIDPTRQWILDRRSHFEAEFGEMVAGELVLTPPAGSPTLVPKFCLDTTGTLHAEFTAYWGTINKPPPAPFGEGDLSLEIVDVNLDPTIQVSGIVAGDDGPSATGWPTLLILVVTGTQQIRAFNLDLDAWYFQPGTDIAFPDSIASQMVALVPIPGGGIMIPAGVLSDVVATLDQVNTTPGGSISGSLDATLNVWIPPPPPPAAAAARACGLGFELALLIPALRWLRSRRRSAGSTT